MPKKKHWERFPAPLSREHGSGAEPSMYISVYPDICATSDSYSAIPMPLRAIPAHMPRIIYVKPPPKKGNLKTLRRTERKGSIYPSCPRP